MHFTERDGLPNNVVYGVLADTQRHAVAEHEQGALAVRSRDAGGSGTTTPTTGCRATSSTRAPSFSSRSGELFFGGIYGFNYFRPEEIRDNPHVPEVAITGFRRGNRYETVRDSGTVLRTTISETDTLRLSYRDAVLTFEFAALEYSAPAKNRYAYRMVGFNDDWIESGSVRAATYTNLPPGRYTFQVRASNNDGVWNETRRVAGDSSSRRPGGGPGGRTRSTARSRSPRSTAGDATR